MIMQISIVCVFGLLPGLLALATLGRKVLDVKKPADSSRPAKIGSLFGLGKPMPRKTHA